MRRSVAILASALLAIMLFAASSATSASPVTGVWTNVTPAGLDPSVNYGIQSVVVDPQRASDLYFSYDRIYKSVDYGLTWAAISDATFQSLPGGLSIAPGTPPTLFTAYISGPGTGFWRSSNGGVTWARSNIAPAGARQDVYPPVVDPYDITHLLITAHEADGIYQSVDQGQNWTNVPIAAGMRVGAGTGLLFFVNTGNASTTRSTWLWMAQGANGAYGTWRTTDAGTTWTKVESNEHPHGSGQIYQPDTSGVVYMGGIYSALGWGVLRSTNYGLTWTHVGNTGAASVVLGTPNNVYAEYSWACGPGCNVWPNLQVAPQPGVAGWTAPTPPAPMVQGAAQGAVTFDGSNYVLLTANWSAGLWRYVEPAGLVPTPTPTPIPPTAAPLSTATALPTATSTATPLPTSSSTPAPTATAAPTATSVACQVETLVNGTPVPFTRPTSFCTNQ